MKNLRLLGVMAIALAILMGGISSCGKKKKGDDPEPEKKNPFVGTWVYEKQETTAKNSDPTLSKTTFKYEFTKDEKFTYLKTETYSDNSQKEKDSANGTYSWTETTITLSNNKKGTLSGGNLTIDGSVFAKQ